MAASAAVILKVVDAEELPLRVFFGAAPLEIAKADYAAASRPGRSGTTSPCWRRRQRFLITIDTT